MRVLRVRNFAPCQPEDPVDLSATAPVDLDSHRVGRATPPPTARQVCKFGRGGTESDDPGVAGRPAAVPGLGGSR
jgi:hypothetical protein